MKLDTYKVEFTTTSDFYRKKLWPFHKLVANFASNSQKDLKIKSILKIHDDTVSNLFL